MKKAKIKDVFLLFLTFFKIGLFSFGGGYGMISLIEREVVTKRKWLTMDEMLTILAVAESTPGPISVNTATYVGEKKAGILGGIFATLGVVLPSFLIIFAISFVFEAVKDNKYIMYAFKGIRVAVVILILNAFVNFFKRMDKNVFSILIMLIILALTLFTTVSTIYYLLAAGALGIIYFSLEKLYKDKKAMKVAPTETKTNADGSNSNVDDVSGDNKWSDEDENEENRAAKITSSEAELEVGDNGIDGDIISKDKQNGENGTNKRENDIIAKNKSDDSSDGEVSK